MSLWLWSKTQAVVITMDILFLAATEKIMLSVQKNQSDAVSSDCRGTVCIPPKVRLLTFKYRI
jgi:hypothetical protein